MRLLESGRVLRGGQVVHIPPHKDGIDNRNVGFHALHESDLDSGFVFTSKKIRIDNGEREVGGWVDGLERFALDVPLGRWVKMDGGRCVSGSNSVRENNERAGNIGSTISSCVGWVVVVADGAFRQVSREEGTVIFT